MDSSFFSPSSVVIIGASSTSGKVGNDLVKNLGDFTGEKYGVNPKGGSGHGIDFHTSVAELPSVPSLAVIAIPEKYVYGALEECGEKGIYHVVIISAGFKEMGNVEGEKKIQDIGGKYTMNILGPNCLGFLNPHCRLNLSFASSQGVGKGGIALVSQSGAMAVAMMDWAKGTSLGFSKVVSMGNKAGIHEGDCLKSLASDPETDVIVLYLESIENGESFYKTLKSVTKQKPVIIVKSGVSQKGASAAASHTGALSGGREVLETALKQAGSHSTHSLKHMFLWSEIFSLTKGKKVPEECMIITNAGGPGVMTVDNAEKYNVKLVDISSEWENILKDGMPEASSMHNPLDILGDASDDRYEKILHNIENIPSDTFSLLVLLTPQTTTDCLGVAKKIVDFQKKYPEKIVMTSFMGGESVEESRVYLQSHGVLHFEYPKDALEAYSRLQIQRKWEAREEESALLDLMMKGDDLKKVSELIGSQSGLCTPSVVSSVLNSLEIPFAQEVLITKKEEIGMVWNRVLGDSQGKCVMKISSPDIAHKTDVGGVVLNISSLEDAEKSFSDIIESVQNAVPQASISGVTLQKMFPPSKEVFLGMKRDETFGSVLIFGLGGIYLNVFEDVSRRIMPIGQEEIHEMMQEIQSYPLLSGVRGEKEIDFESLIDVIMKLQKMFVLFPEIEEVDINPIFSTEKGSVIMDAKLFVSA